MKEQAGLLQLTTQEARRGIRMSHRGSNGWLASAEQAVPQTAPQDIGFS